MSETKQNTGRYGFNDTNMPGTFEVIEIATGKIMFTMSNANIEQVQYHVDLMNAAGGQSLSDISNATANAMEVQSWRKTTMILFGLEENPKPYFLSQEVNDIRNQITKLQGELKNIHSLIGARADEITFDAVERLWHAHNKAKSDVTEEQEALKRHRRMLWMESAIAALKSGKFNFSNLTTATDFVVQEFDKRLNEGKL